MIDDEMMSCLRGMLTGIVVFGLAALVILALAGCATGPNEKPVWKGYYMDVKRP